MYVWVFSFLQSVITFFEVWVVLLVFPDLMQLPDH